MRKPINGAWTATAIGATALLTTALTATALACPDSAPARLLNLEPSHEARASALIAGANPKAADMALAQQETLQSLRQAPANPTAWLRLAYIDSRRPEGLGPTGIQALSRSYEAAPFGPDDTAWRLRFAFNHWTRLDKVTRLLVLDELRVALSDPDKRTHALAQDVSDSAGRLAVTMSVYEAERLRRRRAEASPG